MAATVAREAPPPRSRLLTLPVLSWGAYDLANTIFSMNIVSLYLGVWVVNVMGGTDATWGYTNSLSMALMFLTAPILGAISDQAGRRLPFLLVSTLVCVTFTLLLGTGGLTTTLIFYVIANYFFQAGLIFYDSTLPVVSTPENRGRVGGIGVGMGYIGSFIGVAVGLATLERFGYVFVFRMTAILFVLFALPIFFFVREPKRNSGFRFGADTIGNAVRQVKQTISQVGRYRGLGRFLIGRAFYADAANTLIVFMGVYVTNEIGFNEQQVQILLLVAIATAAIGGFALGQVVDRIGPRRTLNGVMILWMVVFSLAFAIPVLDLPNQLFWAVACMAGIGLGGTWASDRPLMLILAPPGRIGEFYGLYSLVGRFAAIVGPAVWALISDTLGFGRPAAILSLLVMVIIAYVILGPVDDKPREWTGADAAQAPEDK